MMLTYPGTTAEYWAALDDQELLTAIDVAREAAEERNTD